MEKTTGNLERVSECQAGNEKIDNAIGHLDSLVAKLEQKFHNVLRPNSPACEQVEENNCSSVQGETLRCFAGSLNRINGDIESILDRAEN